MALYGVGLVNGADGKSAYQYAVDGGFKGTEEEFAKLLNGISDLQEDVYTVEAIAKGRNQALAYNNYSEMITALNNMSADELNRGQNIYIATLGVPDLWVYGVEETNVEYIYVDDDTFVEGLNVNTTVQVGYYKLAQLETQKVDIDGLADDIDTLQDDVENITPRVEILESDTNSLQNELLSVKDTLGYTVKNLLENIGATTTSNGVTFTVNDDGSVTVNGTATANASLKINYDFDLPNGEYILSGCPKGGTTNTYYLHAYGEGINCHDIGQGGTFVANDNKIDYVRILILSGQTVNNLTFYPMIRKASDTDDTYEPYRDNVDTRLNNVASILGWKTARATGGTLIELDGVYGEIEISIRVKYGANDYYGNLNTTLRNINLSNTPVTKTLSGGVTLGSNSSTTCKVTYTISKTMFQVTQIEFGSQVYDISNVNSISLTYR